ncbi:MAG: 30S ribosomal protein S6 [Acidobacteria bacterium]|uniref:Small ribosomal subunit protein bS6 n=1 Tax=Candidatus Polarisedimenticola svalbardensis TaxID=2886004 RepID=A0A8J7C1Z4_9BACT|nr:30S ribosomal protein S6 [Candidatus Polarisedimenticola svalbardensis]
MKTYESIIITTPEMPESDEKTLIDGMVSIITERDGQLHINDRMGRRRLAYPIKKTEDGVYTRLLYDSGSDAPQEVERRLRLSDKVLRVMTVALEKVWAEDAKKEAVRLIEEKAENARREIEDAKKAEEDAIAAAAAAAAAPAVEEATAEGEEAAEGAEAPEAPEVTEVAEVPEVPEVAEVVETAEVEPTEAATEDASAEAVTEGEEKNG